MAFSLTQNFIDAVDLLVSHHCLVFLFMQVGKKTSKSRQGTKWVHTLYLSAVSSPFVDPTGSCQGWLRTLIMW